jgi:hypothetical protein
MSVEIVERDGGRYCFDCPDIGGKRPRCCRDEHTDRRLAGDDRPFEGIEIAREISDREAAAGITPEPSRQVRRRRQRKGKA